MARGKSKQNGEKNIGRVLARKQAEQRQRERLDLRRREAKNLAKIQLTPRKKPKILSAALDAMNGDPNPRDPWSFHSVLENQAGTERAEKFIEIIRRTRRSRIVDSKLAVEAVWELAGMEWIRPLASWKSKGTKAETKFRSLARHLTCRYAMPEFLFTAFFIHIPIRGLVAGPRTAVQNKAQMIRLFEYLAGGGSVKKAVRDDMLPVAFTKRMCHEFMQGPASGDIYTAIRYAQVRSSGGDERLSRAIASTRLGRGLHDANTEDRWLLALAWFCRQGMLNPDSVGPLVDYIEHRYQEADFEITGRSVAAMTRGMEAWHELLALQGRNRNEFGGDTYSYRKPPAKFESTGLEPVLQDYSGILYSVEEILTMNELRTEGSAMRHCVSSYWHRIESGQTSIWTLQRDGSRALTIEVDNTTRAVVQARGACNAPPKGDERMVMYNWATKNNLRVRV